MEGVMRVSTKYMSRDKWLIERNKTIGGSDAAGIVGLSRWASPFSVWAEKTGRMPEKEDTEAMRQVKGMYDYSRNQKIAMKKSEEAHKKNQLIIIMSILSFLIISVLIVLYLYNKKQVLN